MTSVKIDWGKVDRPEQTPGRFPSRRSVVYGTKGVVASSQPLATEAGLEILRKGGNAADAAVAVSAALNVTEPSCCGVGGDAFCLFYDAKTRAVKALNGSGHSPQKLTLEYAKSRVPEGSLRIPLTDLNSVTVPGCKTTGAAAAWVDTVEHFGSGKLTVAEVLEPAIRLAEEGVPVSELHSFAWQRSEALIQTASPNGNEMLLDGRAPLPGEIIKLPNLAQTFREISTKGKDGFYTGRIAQEVVNLIQSKGGVMELDDLANHRTTFVDPISYTYAGEVTVYECPPNGQGLTALLALGILEQMQKQGLIKPLSELQHNSAEYLHAVVEAMRLAFADSQWYVTDPDFTNVPVAKLLSEEYLASRAKTFDASKANRELKHGNPFSSSDTVYFTVTDQWGNACSYIQSNYAERRLWNWRYKDSPNHSVCEAHFLLDQPFPKDVDSRYRTAAIPFPTPSTHSTLYKGGKRPYHTIIPALATRNGELFLSYGVMGGYMQPQGHVQVLLNVLRGFTVQDALDAPRFCISPGMTDASSHQPGNVVDSNSEVYFEDGIPPATLAKLKELGHDPRSVGGWGRSMMGRGQIIQKVTNKAGRLVWAAGSDLRADGHAAAQI
ncbi:hypothetical protein ONZ45_g3021 [Pleurotus djamor]|nr:hypothetical protein ONZ45_g3021 [Pleurotus djamor]